MRVLILIAGAALALSGCGNNDQAANTMNVDESLTAEGIFSNDVTAIDAVTGADANIAADVNYIDEVDNDLDNAAGGNEQAATNRSRRSGSRDSLSSSNTDEAEPASQNSAGTATANNAL